MWSFRHLLRLPVSPIRVFLLVLIVVCLAETGVMILLPSLLPVKTDERLLAVVDPCLLTLITAPILWWVIIGPLRRWEREAIRVESMSMIAQLATGVAHEVRNPLTSVKMLVQSNLGTVQSAELKEDLGIIESEIRRMESTLNSFLEYARPRPPARQQLKLLQVVGRTRALIEGRCKKQGVEIETTTTGHPSNVYADPEQLQQVLLNLSLNAIDVMPTGGTLTFNVDDCSGECACVHVMDTGPGISHEHASRLFEPFFTTRETGVGLGLVISRRIAQDHGGDLVFRNRPEGGTRFTLRIPKAKAS